MMATLLHPTKGSRPWLPAPDVTALEEYDRHDIPLVGLVKQGATTYLYVCLFGEVEHLNIWAYVAVTDDEIDRIEQHEGPDFLDEVRSVLANKMLVVAFAEDWELRFWYNIDAGEEGPLRIARRFVGVWKAGVNQRDELDEISRQRELVDA